MTSYPHFLRKNFNFAPKNVLLLRISGKKIIKFYGNTMITLKDIKSIRKSKTNKGYDLIMNDDRVINIHKRRCIPALLTLIKFGEGCESDLTKSTTNLSELKEFFDGKIDSNIIKDSYGDANKPFSELWTEEGFTFITNPPNQTRNGSKKYVLAASDHEKLFNVVKKAERRPPSNTVKSSILKRQSSKCNFCGTFLKEGQDIETTTFARDRVRLVWDHRHPVEKNGTSDDHNYQALCFMCNKHKWQICQLCTANPNCMSCALAFPENNEVILPTQENISDRLPAHQKDS